MFITLPIRKFQLDGNKLTVNESVIEYDTITEDSKEILESLISKGAYYSALLQLNWNNEVKSINESELSNDDYATYLQECNLLMKERIVETEARNFRPLTNINGLEIMENDNYIARGKGNTLMIEDFRTVLKEQDVRMPSEPSDGWGEDIEDLTSEFFDLVDRVSYEIKNARRGSYGIDGDDIDSLVRVFEEISSQASDLASLLQSTEVNYTDEEDEDLQESEGTQCNDIAARKDQEVGRLQKPKKTKKLIVKEDSFVIPKNHNFRGFMLDEQGRFVRGNYVLINENGNIRAIHKDKIEGGN